MTTQLTDAYHLPVVSHINTMQYTVDGEINVLETLLLRPH